MKKLFLITPLLIAVPASGQSLLAHWDFDDGTNSSASFNPEENSHPCVTPHTATRSGLSWSGFTQDSEDGSSNGANCFGSWDSGDFVSFKVTADNNAVGSLSSFDFDITNYNHPNDPTSYRLTVYENNVLLPGLTVVNGITTGVAGSDPWTSNFSESLALSLNTTAGSTDMWEFRIEALGGSSSGRITLDNVRVFGDITCIPEPSSTLMCLVASLALFNRRRR